MKHHIQTVRIKRILVVDDEPDLIDLYQMELVRRGFDCQTAGSGNEALALIKENPFDLVITDFRMPNGTGLDLLRGSLSHSTDTNRPRIPFIIITGFVEQGVVTALLEGASSVHGKPVSFKEIVEDIQMLDDTVEYTQQRVHVRRNAQISVRVTSEDSKDAVVLPARNISVGGMQVVSSDTPLVVNCTYDLVFVDPDMRHPIHNFCVKASCVWQRREQSDDDQSFLIGLAFEEESKKDIILSEILSYV